MNIDNSLISTALLALQQSQKVNFDINHEKSGKTGFWYELIENEGQNNALSVDVLIYFDSTSTTGYAIEVVFADGGQTMLERQIESFADFREILEYDFRQNIAGLQYIQWSESMLEILQELK
jgi:hypothetical protein